MTLIVKSKTKCNTMGFFFNNFTDIFKSARLKTVLKKNHYLCLNIVVYRWDLQWQLFEKSCFFFKWFILLWFPIELLWSFFYMSTFYKQSWLWRRFLCRKRIHRSLHYHYARFNVNHFTCISAQINLEPNWNMDLRTLKSKWK